MASSAVGTVVAEAVGTSAAVEAGTVAAAVDNRVEVDTVVPALAIVDSQCSVVAGTTVVVASLTNGRPIAVVDIETL